MVESGIPSPFWYEAGRRHMAELERRLSSDRILPGLAIAQEGQRIQLLLENLIALLSQPGQQSTHGQDRGDNANTRYWKLRFLQKINQLDGSKLEDLTQCPEMNVYSSYGRTRAIKINDPPDERAVFLHCEGRYQGKIFGLDGPLYQTYQRDGGSEGQFGLPISGKYKLANGFRADFEGTSLEIPSNETGQDSVTQQAQHNKDTADLLAAWSDEPFWFSTYPCIDSIRTEKSATGVLGSIMGIELDAEIIDRPDYHIPWGEIYLHRNGPYAGKACGIPFYIPCPRSLGFPTGYSLTRGTISFEKGSVDISKINASDIKKYIETYESFIRLYDLWTFLNTNSPRS